MIFYVRRDARLRERWTTDLEGLAREFGLSPAEYEALRDQDIRRLNFWIDEEFDRWFLDLLKQGDDQALLRECTLERMGAAGSGGTAELLAWILVLAFTTRPADVLAYMPAIAWRSGTGMVAWSQLA